MVGLDVQWSITESKHTRSRPYGLGDVRECLGSIIEFVTGPPVQQAGHWQAT